LETHDSSVPFGIACEVTPYILLLGSAFLRFDAYAAKNPTIGIEAAPTSNPKRPDKKAMTTHLANPAANGNA